MFSCAVKPVTVVLTSIDDIFKLEVEIHQNRIFLQYFDTVGWVFWPVKTVSHYNL